MWTDSIFEKMTPQTGISQLDITSGILEIKLLISDFSIVDFRFSGIVICDF